MRTSKTSLITRQRWTLAYGLKENKKALIFTLDVAIGIFLVITLLLITNYYTSRIDEPTLTKVQTAKVGSEFISNVDVYIEYESYSDFDDLANEIIKRFNKAMVFFKPKDYDVRVQLYGEVPGYKKIPLMTFGSQIKPNTFVASGERIIVKPVTYTSGGSSVKSYANIYLRYWIWQDPR